jgi:exonuclease III
MKQLKNLPENSKIIIMGDFNSVPNPALDRNNDNTSNTPETHLLKKLLHRLSDVYRITHPNKRVYTCKSGDSESRIDLTLISSNIMRELSTKSTISETNIPALDHKAIHFSAELPIRRINFSLQFVPKKYSLQFQPNILT